MLIINYSVILCYLNYEKWEIPTNRRLAGVVLGVPTRTPKFLEIMEALLLNQPLLK